MTTINTADSFFDFIQTADARNTIQLNIVKYCLMLCDALEQGAPKDYTFRLDSSGRKYHRIHMWIGERRDSIHAFIDKKTGEVYKPASIKGPAKGVRFNLCIISDREKCLECADWAGGYLYAR